MKEFNYNRLSFDLEYPDEPLCLRAKLDIGLRCQLNCSFCYYKHNLRDPELDFNIIKDRIDLLSKYTKNFDISGGEPTLHSRWFDILDYCMDKGAGSVSCLSNGIKFADYDFIEKSKEHGLNEILFSLHSVEDIHNKMVGSKHAYPKIYEAILNAKELGIRVRINSVVNNINYMYIDNEFLRLINSLEPFEINFLPVNYFADAKNNELYDYNIILNPIKKFIDNYDKTKIKYINVRYTPYCFMQGYEKYVCNYFQHFYDLYDWNIAMYHYREPNLQNMIDIAKTARITNYCKPKKCLECKYFNICDGIEKQLKIDFEPIKGNKIKNPIEFRTEFYA